MSQSTLRHLQRLLETPYTRYRSSLTAEMHRNGLLLEFIEHIPLGVIIADAHGNFLVISKKLRDSWSAYAGNDNLTKSFLEDAEVCFHMDGTPMTKDDWPMHITIRTHQIVKMQQKVYINHRWIYVEVTSSPMFSEDGNLLYVFVYTEDITEKLEKEEQIAFARVQTDFLARMSHELRTPMHGILGMLDYISPSSSEQAYDLGVLKRSGEDLLRTLNDILDYTKIDAGHVEVDNAPFSIPHMVEDLVCLFSTKCPTFSVDIKDVPETIKGDSYLIKQCLNNLINNAIKFVQPDTTPSVSMEIKVDKRDVIFTVKDKGIGMTPDQLSKVFTPFIQANSSITRTYGGTGLGLTNVKRLANKMGGEISVESKINRGSTFILSLPLLVSVETVELKASPPAKRRKMGPTVEEKTFNSKYRLLLAEDNPINKVVTTSLLKKHGFQVDAVENGIEVLERIAADGTYDLLLLDIQMPKMGGHETCRILRERCWNKPIIALTASAMESDREKCLVVGMNDYMSKPFKMEELEPKIHRLCNRGISSPFSLGTPISI